MGKPIVEAEEEGEAEGVEEVVVVEAGVIDEIENSLVGSWEQ